MNEVLRDAFRHNSWATRQLLAACQGLSQEQLNTTATGSFGSILATFNHIILADARYLQHLGGTATAWLVARERSDDLGQLEQRVEETAQLWEQLLDEPIDAERLLILGNGDFEARAGIVIAQALHHGNAHREQICAMLTSYGQEPPDMQPWAYSIASGRGRERRSDERA